MAEPRVLTRLRTVTRKRQAHIDAEQSLRDERDELLLRGREEGLSTARLAEAVSVEEVTVRSILRRARLRDNGA